MEYNKTSEGGECGATARPWHFFWYPLFTLFRRDLEFPLRKKKKKHEILT